MREKTSYKRIHDAWRRAHRPGTMREFARGLLLGGKESRLARAAWEWLHEGYELLPGGKWAKLEEGAK